MKVFLSWSGEKSHKVALVFRDWFPSVIQSLEPYVSSEDIDKGTRWSTDIAKELEDSSFGVLCVTKENLTAPWLTFEAGALSKTMDKAFVSPFLFDIKRSEVDGPILQFQSTIFSQEDVFKLIKTLNKACGEDQLTDERLDKAFSVWWPTLEEELNKLKDFQEQNSFEPDNNSAIANNDILEEILDLSRLNQKLLRNPDNEISKIVVEVNEKLKMTLSRLEHERRVHSKKRKRFHPEMIEDLLHGSPRFGGKNIGFQMVLSLFREDFPWLYEAGMDVVRKIKEDKSNREINQAISEFMEIVEFSFEHPIMREMFMPDKEQYMMLRELSYMLKKYYKNE
jgi:hypothetical protein